VGDDDFDLGKPSSPRDPGGLSWRDATIVGGLALALPSMLIAPPALGMWLDHLFDTKPWLFFIFLVIGFLGTGIDVYLILKRSKVIR
jgi:hypothetical protein